MITKVFFLKSALRGYATTTLLCTVLLLQSAGHRLTKLLANFIPQISAAHPSLPAWWSAGAELRQNYIRKSKQSLVMQVRYAHARQEKAIRWTPFFAALGISMRKLLAAFLFFLFGCRFQSGLSAESWAQKGGNGKLTGQKPTLSGATSCKNLSRKKPTLSGATI